MSMPKSEPPEFIWESTAQGEDDFQCFQREYPPHLGWKVYRSQGPGGMKNVTPPKRKKLQGNRGAS